MKLCFERTGDPLPNDYGIESQNQKHFPGSRIQKPERSVFI